MSGQWNAGGYGGPGGYQQGGYGAQQGSQQVVTCSHLTSAIRDCRPVHVLASHVHLTWRILLLYSGNDMITRLTAQMGLC